MHAVGYLAPRTPRLLHRHLLIRSRVVELAAGTVRATPLTVPQRVTPKKSAKRINFGGSTLTEIVSTHIRWGHHCWVVRIAGAEVLADGLAVLSIPGSKCPNVLSPRLNAMGQANTTYVAPVNGEVECQVLVESIGVSILVGPDPSTDLAVFQSTSVEAGGGTKSTQLLRAATSPDGVGGEVETRRTLLTGVCHVDKRYPPPP